MIRNASIIHRKVAIRLLLLAAVLAIPVAGYLSHASGATLPQRSLELSNSTASAVASYALTFTIPNSETLGSIELQFCSDSPLIGLSCDPPAGFDISSAVLSSQSGVTDFSILATGTNPNTIVLTRIPSPVAGGTVSYTFTNVTNPSSDGPLYGRLQTFASSDASGSNNDQGGLAMSINSAVNVSTTVPPYLLFCSGLTITGFDCGTASGNYINFGDLSSSTTGSADSQLLTATNAENGFTIRIEGTTMTSGNNVINAMAARDVSRPGVSQFGVNLVKNTTPAVGDDPQGSGSAVPDPAYSQPDWYQFIPDSVIASATAPDEYKQFTASYIINISNNQPPGVYASTLTYVCLANF